MIRRTNAALLVGLALTAGSCTVTAAEPAILASYLSTNAGPIEWESSPDSPPDPVFSSAFQAGDYCYGNSEPPPPSNREMMLLGRTFTLSVGRYIAPNVSFRDDDGVTDLGNPFGEDAWLCTAVSDGASVLAVGSDVWWSNDGITWQVIEAFQNIGGNYFEDSDVGDSNLIWAAVGPLGYVVLGHSGSDGWFSPDLTTWYQIPPHQRPDNTSRGWFGPGNVTISDEMIVIGSIDWTGAQIGTRTS